jgi:hypothetical protein
MYRFGTVFQYCFDVMGPVLGRKSAEMTALYRDSRGREWTEVKIRNAWLARKSRSAALGLAPQLSARRPVFPLHIRQDHIGGIRYYLNDINGLGACWPPL